MDSGISPPKGLRDGAISKLVLFCLPLFARYTRVLFRMSGQVFLLHLVLALHFHTFIFLGLLVSNGWSFLFGFVGSGLSGAVDRIAVLRLPTFPFLMLKHLFGNGWGRTILKPCLLGTAYLATLGLGFFLTAVALVAFL